MARRLEAFRFSTPEGFALCRSILKAMSLPFDPHDYQLEGVCQILDGLDLLAVTPTGSGKTGFIYILLLVLYGIQQKPELRPPGVRIFPKDPVIFVVCPTNALEEDMVSLTQNHGTMSISVISTLQAVKLNAIGVKAIAINSNTIQLAYQTQTDNPYKVARGDVSALLLSPEQLISPAFEDLLQDQKFYKRIFALCVDEVHLMYSWGAGFRKSFNQIGHMRNRLPQDVRLMALTATLRHGEPKEAICTFLRLLPGQFHFIRRSNARHDVQIIFRTMQSASTGHCFPELSWVLFEKRKFIIFAKEIYVGFRIMAYLWQESQSIGGHTPTLRLYNSLNWPSHNTDTLALLHTTEHHLPIIVIATDTLSVGVDIPDINDVILWGEPKDSDELLQKLGRAGRQSRHSSSPNTSNSCCIIYISRSSIATAHKMVEADAEDTKDARHKKNYSGEPGMDISAAQLIAGKCKSLTIDSLYNNPVTDVPCRCEGCLQQECTQAHPCQCSGCKADIVPAIFTPPSTSIQTTKRTRRITKAMCEHGVKELQQFRLKLWQEADEAKTSWTPPSAFIPNSTIKILLDHIYIVESADDIMARDRDNELLQPHTVRLLQFLHNLKNQFEDMRQQAKADRMSLKNKASPIQDESEDSEDEEPKVGQGNSTGIRWILKPSYVFLTTALGSIN
ncbi:hypothetical protein AX14_010991 [Amanita brunnescens Koide BX004]|nr:hypothetical protein AX14_010991 [Amanita brunnescens Koide BX004]